MILTDAGPLIALVDQDDHHHTRCHAVLSTLGNQPLLTTWACLSEVLHILGNAGGYRFQSVIWEMRSQNDLQILNLDEIATDKVAMLMERYQDVPMDLADATLVVAAEQLGVRTLFTLDSDFRIYRLGDGSGAGSTAIRRVCARQPPNSLWRNFLPPAVF